MRERNMRILAAGGSDLSMEQAVKKLFRQGLSLLIVGIIWVCPGTGIPVWAAEGERSVSDGILAEIQVHSYDSDEDYMAKMYEASMDGSVFALEAGAIYEVQRNLKIEREQLNLEATSFFTAGDSAEEIQYQLEVFLGVVEEPRETVVEMSVPAGINTSFKTYMDYRTITSKASRQYQMQQQAYTENGFRKLEGRYMVAMGSYYGYCGDKFNITLDTGQTIPVIIGDSKADHHTDSLHMYRPMKSGYGNVVEFIVDGKTIDPIARKMGDVSHVSAELQGGVAKIEKLI